MGQNAMSRCMCCFYRNNMTMQLSNYATYRLIIKEKRNKKYNREEWNNILKEKYEKIMKTKLGEFIHWECKENHGAIGSGYSFWFQACDECIMEIKNIKHKFEYNPEGFTFFTSSNPYYNPTNEDLPKMRKIDAKFKKRLYEYKKTKKYLKEKKNKKL